MSHSARLESDRIGVWIVSSSHPLAKQAFTGISCVAGPPFQSSGFGHRSCAGHHVTRRWVRLPWHPSLACAPPSQIVPEITASPLLTSSQCLQPSLTGNCMRQSHVKVDNATQLYRLLAPSSSRASVFPISAPSCSSYSQANAGIQALSTMQCTAVPGK